MKYFYTYKDSHSQTKIPKFSFIYKSWCNGNTKPNLYSDWWVLRLEIHYIETIEELQNTRKYIVDFDYTSENAREYARNARDLAITNLMLDGLTVVSSTIKLMANRV